MKRVGIIVTLAALWCMALTGLANAQDKVVKVKGEGVIFNKDQALAEEKAIEMALRQAVEQGVGVYVKSNTLVDNYVTIDDKIMSQAQGYVKTYKKLSSKVADGVVEVELEVTVSMLKLKGALDELQAMLSRKNYPRIMMMIAEQNVGQSSMSHWWGNTTSVISMGQVENTIINELSPVGFTFVDSQVLSGKVRENKAFKVLNAQVSNDAAREIANLTDAEIIIIGTAIANDAGTIMGTKMHSGQADLTVRVINTDNGRILFTSSTHGVSQHVMPQTAGKRALMDATKKMVKDFKQKITTAWSKNSTVSITVNGIRSYPMLKDFESTLANAISGVQGVVVRSMDKQSATVEVTLSGKIDVFARDMVQKPFKGVMVRVDKQHANSLTVTLIKK